MLQICNVVGQESAHAFGLDHEIECADPLTYIGGCPVKAFQNIDAPCREFAERECSCGGNTQNSFVAIESIFASCELDIESCPHNFDCAQAVDGQLVCVPEEAAPGGGGFCSGAGSSSSAGWALLLLLWALYGTRKRDGKAWNRRPQG